LAIGENNVKKLFVFLAATALSLLIFGAISFTTEANENIFGNGNSDELEIARQKSIAILREDSLSRVIGNPDEFKVKRVEIDELNMAHTHVVQVIGGVPVWEGEAIVHLKSDGALASVTDDLKEGVIVNTTPGYTAEQILDYAKRLDRGSRFITEAPIVDLYIYRGEDRDRLVYRVEMARLDGTEFTSAPVRFIDAHTLETVFGYDNLQTGSGNSLYSGTVSMGTSSSGGTFYMEDTTRRLGTFNMNNTGNTTTGTGGTQSRYTDADDNWTATNARAGVDAHYGAEKTYDYYKNVHGRNGINGSNGPGTTAAAANSGISLVSSRVHFGSNYNNAFWYQNKMSYGDGNGTTFSPLTTLDIAGHEMTHGVTQFSANLTYANESGALNESMSDVFGAMVESYARGGVINGDTWKIGEQSYTPNTSGDALRYMDNPHLAGNGGYTSDDDPDHYAERYTGSGDSGGVHINSGIGNKAFYLAVVGGTHHRSGVTVTGMGATNAARIWYRALTVYMTASTNFAGARTAMLNSATDLFGSSSSQYNTIATTWCAVGVGSCPAGPTPTPTATPTPNPTPTPGGCSGGSYSGTLSGTGATAIQPNGTYYQSTTSGTHTATLTGPGGTDFDLRLYRWNGFSWSSVASSLGATSSEFISYSGSAGYYYWRINSYSGSGAYSLCTTRP
jgi:thermolysin